MVHPSELLRTDSIEEPQFSAPADILDKNLIDCGLSNLPCLNRCLNLEKYAKLKVFVIFLSAIGFLHGFTLYYFRRTAEIWSQHYNISQSNIEWLIYTNEFFVGFIALFVAHYGNKIHRMAWIGALTIFHSVNCFVLIIPEVYKTKNATVSALDDLNLCKNELRHYNLEKEEMNYVAVGVLIIFQIFYAMATVSFSTHGLTYMDDNAHKKHSPAVLGIVLGVRELGKQAGLYSSGFRVFFGKEFVFLSPVWISAAGITFISGVIIAMFPKYLPSILLERVSASILYIATGSTCVINTVKEPVDGLFKTLWRLMKNQVLVMNIVCTVFIQSAIINLGIYENIFNQSHFQIAARNNSSFTQFAIDLLKQPLIAISVVASGMIVSKSNPRIKSLVIYNIIVLVLVLLFFSTTAFLECDEDINIEHDNYYYLSSCNQNCAQCSSNFQPVCVDNHTYFSPCFAGCLKVKNNGREGIYQNCSCGNEGKWTGIEGSCSGNNCYIYWALSQANGVLISALLASTFVPNLLINMRSIRQTDKATALGLEATFLGLIPYVPVKLAYGAIVDKLCKVRDHGVCYYHLNSVGLFLSCSTAVLMFISILFEFILYFCIDFKYNISENVKDRDPGKESVEMSSSNHRAPESMGLMSNNYQSDRGEDEIDASLDSGLDWNSHESLKELENVGDDHDSFGSLDYPRPRQK